ncbi:MAG: NAD(P)H-dependent oxidoreductase [Burkholderiales bacterium]|jgi:NAD(P)H dehydrogenase (quinone)|nr:NAD(P)H-dependent oxidoreductase [Burkholderiales bacterium]
MNKEVNVKKVYMIVAHPNRKGLCFAAFENLKRGLEAAGHEIKISDLYQENFNPVLFFDENKLRRDLQHDPEVQVYREAILWADHLVFVFPVWWSGMPAILKGFIDRVFAKGFAYEYDSKSHMKGLIKNKTAWIVNAQDAPGIVRFVPFIIHDYGLVLKRQILMNCGFKKVQCFPIFSVIKSTPERRSQWLQKLYHLGEKL